MAILGYSSAVSSVTRSIEATVVGELAYDGAASVCQHWYEVVDIYFYHNPTNTGRAHKFGIYDHDAGTVIPNSESATVAPAITGWQWHSTTYGTKPTLDYGKSYLLCVFGSSGTGSNYVGGTTAGAAAEEGHYVGATWSTLPTTPSWTHEQRRYAIYVNVNVLTYAIPGNQDSLHFDDQATVSIEVPPPPDIDINVSQTISMQEGLAPSTIAESYKIDDSVTAELASLPQDLSIQVSQSVGITDSPTVKEDFTISVADSYKHSESSTVAQSLAINVSDSYKHSDIPSVQEDLSVTVSEAYKHTDTPSLAEDFIIQQSDALKISELKTVQVQGAISHPDVIAQDNYRISDGVVDIEVEGGQPEDLEVVAQDNYKHTDVPTVTLDMSITVTDGYRHTDSAAGQIKEYNISVSENMGISDTIISVRLNPFHISVVDGYSITDQVTPPQLNPLRISVVDGYKITDIANAQAFMGLVVSVQDSYRISDILSPLGVDWGSVSPSGTETWTDETASSSEVWTPASATTTETWS